MAKFWPITFSSEIGRSWAQAWREVLEADPERPLGYQAGVADEEPQEPIGKEPHEGGTGARSAGGLEAIG